MGFRDWLFPKKCVGCGKMGTYVCEGCSVGMWEEEQICPSCRRASRYGLRHEKCEGPLEGLTCLWSYDGLVKKIIQKVKYKGYYDSLKFLIINFEFLNRPEFFYLKKFLDTNPTVVPVPLHPNRLRKRGFNQAEMIANLAFSPQSLVISNLLTRIKDTGQQVGRTREVRLQNMEGAFEIKKNLSFDFTQDSQNSPRILLVDDVWTTGATMTEAAKTLKQGGVKMVWGWVLAR